MLWVLLVHQEWFFSLLRLMYSVSEGFSLESTIAACVSERIALQSTSAACGRGGKTWETRGNLSADVFCLLIYIVLPKRDTIGALRVPSRVVVRTC